MDRKLGDRNLRMGRLRDRILGNERLGIRSLTSETIRTEGSGARELRDLGTEPQNW